MFVDIVNIACDVIMHVEKDGNCYMMHFRKEEDAIKFAENVLENTEYRVQRFEREIVQEVIDQYLVIGKADL